MKFFIVYKAYIAFITFILISHAPKGKWAHIFQTALIFAGKKKYKK